MKRATQATETPQVGRSVPRLESWLKGTRRAECAPHPRLAGAVVLASDPHVAEEAVHLISAEYEELPAVYGEVEAMTSKAIVHDVLRPAGTYPDLKHLQGKKNTNLALDFRLRRGSPETALKSAHRVFEHRFRTQQVMHTPLEPLVTVAESTEDSLTIHTASQTPSFVRIEVARLLGWPRNRAR